MRCGRCGWTLASGFKKCARCGGRRDRQVPPARGPGRVRRPWSGSRRRFAIRYPARRRPGQFRQCRRRWSRRPCGTRKRGSRRSPMRFSRAWMRMRSTLSRPTTAKTANRRCCPLRSRTCSRTDRRGIAVGMATSIPRHTTSTRICRALLHLLHNPGARLTTLLRHLPGPDFPTGGVPAVESETALHEAYRSGRGALPPAGRLGGRAHVPWSAPRRRQGNSVGCSEGPHRHPAR